MGLRVEQVALSGQRFTADADVFDAIDLANTGSLVTFDAAGARERIEKLPWVSTAAISRIFPGSLDVRITERQPSALWINEGREYLVDASGRVLSALKKGTSVRLPRFSGAARPGAGAGRCSISRALPARCRALELAERVGERRWTLHLKGGVMVHLGADREAVAFAALSSPAELGKLLDAQRPLSICARGGASPYALPGAAVGAQDSASATRELRSRVDDAQRAKPKAENAADCRPARHRNERGRLHYCRAGSASADRAEAGRCAKCSASASGLEGSERPRHRRPRRGGEPRCVPPSPRPSASRT